MNFSKPVKFWVFVTVISYLLYNLWEITKTVEGLLPIFLQPQMVNINPVFILILFCPLIGLIFRFLGSILALHVVNLVWRKETHKFSELRRKISLGVFMEIVYLISIIPNFIFITMIGTPVILGSYIIQTFLTIPFLFILRRKINNNTQNPFGLEIKKWMALTFVTYSAAIWVNHISRWFDMSLIGGIPMLLDALNPLGFFNAAIILSLSVIFAVIGFVRIKQNSILSKWFGASLTMLGLHFIILVIFYIIQNSLNVLYLYELWTIPLFGLRLSIIFNNN
ncbi:MAG: hypothetical protein IAX21_03195 [Candidatus Bathyarchaeota archaeon]|nr:MAG: hypothetical protein IAX21_03195 [Candidatus Bathyarchaeota archaeon]